MSTVNQTYVIADHIRAASFIIADGVKPSGKQRGYILRRLIRRALSASLKLKIDISNQQYFEELVDSVVGIYDGTYPEIKESRDFILQLLVTEAGKYQKALKTGDKEWNKVINRGDTNPDSLAEKTWDLYQSHGVPLEVSEDFLNDKNLTFNQEILNNLIEEHQKKSQQASAGQFKSGLGGDSEKTRRLHTVTHILHAKLREMFGTDVKQMGSAITDQKARFDFSFTRPLDENEVQELTSKVQNVIDKKLEMTKAEMSPDQAKELGAIGLFGEKYGDVVSVYTLEDGDSVYSREFCGGPHIKNTSEIGKFEVIKQKSVGQGVRRIEYNVV